MKKKPLPLNVIITCTLLLKLVNQLHVYISSIYHAPYNFDIPSP